MPIATVEYDPDFSAPVDEPMEAPAEDPVSTAYFNPVSALGRPGELGTRAQIEKELDLIVAAVRLFHMKHPDQVMRECSAYTARLTELAVLLHRIESSNRQYTRIRTQQVERILAEMERQWKTASRLVEVSRQDLSVIGAQA